jgi:hypothetical protein
MPNVTYSQNSSVATVTKVEGERPEIRGLVPGRNKFLSSLSTPKLPPSLL